MGQRITSLFQRPNENVQDVDLANGNAYRWPPKSGNYFGSHFIMGGERFESQQPESFLFGENTDLNFLGSRPVPFPYPTPQLNDPTRTLRSLVNIRKDSVKLVRCELPRKAPEPSAAGDDITTNAKEPVSTATPMPDSDVEAAMGDDSVRDCKYNIEFIFDCDVTCNISIMYFAKEEMVNGAVIYTPRDATMNSEPYTYKRGANQIFSQATHIINAGAFSEEEWTFDFDKEEIPVVIHCTVQNEADYAGHSHVMFCSLEKAGDGYTIKPVKQKQCVDGLLYILQEFYGIENKESDQAKGKDDDEMEDNTAECVICMSEIRDTLILPCRHLCLCNVCADSLRYQASNCPICRAPFRALLQLRAIRKKVPKPDTDVGSDEDEEFPVSQKGVPQGFEAVSLIEALNGPCFYHSKSADPRQRVLASQGSLRHSKKKKKDKGSRTTLKDKDKDKDVIIDEEKAREQNSTEGNVNKHSKQNPAESNTDQQQDEGGNQQSTNSDSKDSENQDQPLKTDSDAAKDGESTKSIAEDEAGDNVSSEDDVLMLSSRTQSSHLPGTPDYVLDEEEPAGNSVNTSV